MVPGFRTVWEGFGSVRERLGGVLCLFHFFRCIFLLFEKNRWGDFFLISENLKIFRNKKHDKVMGGSPRRGPDLGAGAGAPHALPQDDQTKKNNIFMTEKVMKK